MTTFRRVKKIDGVLDDPNTPYRIGQLIGACDMAAHWMTMQDDEETKSMGGRLHKVLEWWWEEVEVTE